jgi:hypothetical protein
MFLARPAAAEHHSFGLLVAQAVAAAQHQEQLFLLLAKHIRQTVQDYHMQHQFILLVMLKFVHILMA